MLLYCKKEEVCVLSIVTVSKYSNYNLLNKTEKKLWENKSKYYTRLGEHSQDEIYNLSAYYPEFGKIACVGMAIFKEDKFHIKNYSNRDEKVVLNNFFHDYKNVKSKKMFLLTYNGFYYEFPFIAKRSIINNLKFPSDFELFGLKDWKFPDKFISINSFWNIGKGGKNYPIETFTELFKISFTESDQEYINKVFHGKSNFMEHDKDLQIIEQCNKIKIETIMKIFLNIKNESTNFVVD